MKLELEIAVSQSGDGFTATVAGVRAVGNEVDQQQAKVDAYAVGLNKLTDALGGVSSKSGGSGGESPFAFLTRGADELIPKLLETVSIVALVEKGLEALGEVANWVKESIGHADFIRDLNLSLAAYVGNAADAAQVTAYLRSEQDKTRNTTEELQQAFRNLNPLETSKGFSLGAQEQITVMLSQVATVANKSFDQIESGFRRMLAMGGSGGGAARNPLLQVLGITAEQLKTMGWDEFLAKLQTAAARSAEFGQSWESTMHKAEDDLKNAFAEGWNDARGSAVQGMDAITAAVADPQVKEFLHDLGGAAAGLAGNLGGILTEVRGLVKELQDAGQDSSIMAFLLATGHLLYARTLGQQGFGGAGNESLIAERNAATTAAGSSALQAAGVLGFGASVGPGWYQSPGGPEHRGQLGPTMDIGIFKDAGNLSKAVGDLIAQDHMNADQQKLFIENLRDAAADARAQNRPFSVQDVMGAGADATVPGAIEGAPHGKLGAGATGAGTADAIAIKTKQLLEQAAVLELQNQKLAVQGQLDQEAAALGEKKTGLENIVLDSATRQLLAQHELNALRVVDLDTQIGITKAVSDYQTALDEIDKKQEADGAKKGGGTVPSSAFDAERAAAFAKYGAAVDEVAAKNQKAQADAIDKQHTLTLAAQATVQARNDEVFKVQGLVLVQKDENNALDTQLTKAREQGQLNAVDLALANQKAVFGGMALDQQAQSLLRQHDAIALQQVANDTEHAMWDERKKEQKEEDDLRKQRAAIIKNAGTIDPVTGLPTDPASVAAMSALEQLAAEQAQGDAIRLATIQQQGAEAMLAAAQKNRDYQVQTMAILLKGYADVANLMNTAVGDLVTGILSGNISGAFKSLAGDIQRQIAGTIDDAIKNLITKLQKMAQGTAQWDPNAPAPGGVGPPGAMVTPTSGQQQTAQTAMATVQGAMALYSIYSGAAGMSKGGAALSGALSGGITGAEIGSQIYPGIGTAVGAVIGAVVGAVAGYLGAGSGKASYTVTISNGQIQMTGGGSAHQSDVDAAIGKINQEIQTGSTAVHGLFDAFPIAIGQSLNMKDLASVFNQVGSRWFDATTLATFMQQDIPAMMLKAYTPAIQGGLAALGVTQAKIASLFSGQATADPTAFFKFITDYVTAFVAMQKTIAFLGESTAEKFGTAATTANPLPIDQLNAANENIAYLGQGIDKLTNTDQVARVQQINAALAARYQIEITAINDIINALKAVKTSYESAVTAMRMSGETASQQIADLQAQADLVAATFSNTPAGASTTPAELAALGAAATPAEVTAVANSYQQLETAIFNAAKSLRDSLQSVLDSFTALNKTKAADIVAALDPSAQLTALSTQAAGIANAFGGMSPEDQITNGQTLLQLATQYYNVQKQALLDLGNAATSIHESIQRQIFGIQYDQLKNDPQAQIEMLMGQQRTLLTSLGTATTAAEIDAIIAQIQGNVTTIAGLEGNTPQAAIDAINALNAANAAAAAQLATLTTQATANDAAITAAINAVTGSITTTVSSLNDMMTTATANLIAFGVLVQQRLDGFMTDLQTSDAALLATLTPIFTALGDVSVSTTTDLVGVGVGLNNFKNGLDDATAALRRFSQGSPTFSTSSFTTPTITNVIQFSPNLDIKVSGSMAPLVDVIGAVFDQKMQTFQTQQSRFGQTRAM